MVANRTDSTTPGPQRVGPRHGGHAAHARAQRALQPGVVRALRDAARTDARAVRAARPRWHTRSGVRELVDAGAYAGGRHVREPVIPAKGDPDEFVARGAAWVWKYDPETGRRQPMRAGTRDRIAWVSRDRYLNAVVPVRLAQPDADGILAACGVDRDTFRRWIWAEATVWADEATGRRIVVRPGEVGEFLEVSGRTVQRCRAAARELDLYATVFRGRMLKQLEQVRCRIQFKSPQRGMACESALVVPRSLARITSVSYLQRGPADGHFSSSPGPVVTLSTRGEREPASPALTTRARRRQNPGWRLARELLKRLPWGRQCAPGEIVGLVWRFATADPCWTAQDVITHVDLVNARNGWSSVTAADVRNPRGLLASYLRDADPQADHPRLDVFLDADRRRAAAAAHQLAAAAGDCTCFGCIARRQGPR